MEDRDTLGRIEEWTGHRADGRPLVFARGFLLLFVLAVLVFLATGCMTEVTRTITTDKSGTVHDVTVTRKGTDPAALKLAEVAAAVYVPRRPLYVREEKSGDLRRILRGRPITRQEIAARWRPAAP